MDAIIDLGYLKTVRCLQKNKVVYYFILLAYSEDNVSDCFRLSHDTNAAVFFSRYTLPVSDSFEFSSIKLWTCSLHFIQPSIILHRYLYYTSQLYYILVEKY